MTDMNDGTKNWLLNQLKGGLIVSCQALPGEPLYRADHSVMPAMARAALTAGARGIRACGVRDVAAIRQETGLPVIGLIKKKYEGYDSYITPTMSEVDALVAAGAHIVALDCTDRARGDQMSGARYLSAVRKKYPKLMLMADISVFEEGIAAAAAGADFIGTTMSGYTPYSPQTLDPDFVLVSRLAAAVDVPVIGEGRIHTPQQAVRMLECGAWSVVVGGAITRPQEIAARFVKELEKKEELY